MISVSSFYLPRSTYDLTAAGTTIPAPSNVTAIAHLQSSTESRENYCVSRYYLTAEIDPVLSILYGRLLKANSVVGQDLLWLT